MDWWIYLLLALSEASLIIGLIALSKAGQQPKSDGSLERMQRDLQQELRLSRQETSQAVQSSVKNLSELLAASQAQSSALQDKRLAELNLQITQRNDTLQRTMDNGLKLMDDRVARLTSHTEQQLEQMRQTMEQRIRTMQEDNGKRLEQMRATVDEKLQKTLEDRIGQSFRLVNDRLEQVYKGLGEMQTLASGVGDLKKVLSNVKTRGIVGEIQLGSILDQILTPEQYDANVVTKHGSSERVEYAVKFPGDEEGGFVYLPIDAKFPADAYAKLQDAYDAGDSVAITEAGKHLDRTIRSFAKDIATKYIDPPYTTDFAIMFLPFEGLYAEVVRRGLVETLQRDYHINIAGPTTMSAILNSLQMGFRTLAIQKHTSEVWKVLGAVKTEFNKFGDALAATQKQLETASSKLETLVGTRTRQIQRKLSRVESLPELQSQQILSLEAIDAFDTADSTEEEKQ